MPYGNYVYTSDRGDDYSITVPTDFATALGMVAATTQPYLDAVINPRYANARSSSGLFRSAIIQDLSVFSTLPGSSITVAGVTYDWVSFSGESTFLREPLFVQPAAIGPPGPAGASAITYQQFLFDSDHNITSYGDTTDLISNTVDGPGTFLVIGRAAFHGTSSDGLIGKLLLRDDTAGVNIAGAMCQAAVDSYAEAVAVGVYVNSGSFTLKMRATNQGGSGSVKHGDIFDTDLLYGVQVIKLS